MQVLLDNNNYVMGYSDNENVIVQGAIDINFQITDHFTSNYKFYTYVNGELKFDSNKEIEDLELQELRFIRSKECFKIVNRGQAWYNTLTEEQKNELQVWYQAWLDVTDKKVIPTTPSWIN